MRDHKKYYDLPQHAAETHHFRNPGPTMWSRGEFSISISVLPAFYFSQHAEDCAVGASAKQDGVLDAGSLCASHQGQREAGGSLLLVPR
jgi:hypothetical protein